MLSDVFNSDIFKFRTLTAAINKLPYKPSKITSMGIFEERGMATLAGVIEERNGTLSLLPVKNRNDTPTQKTAGTRKAHSVLASHIPFDDAILATDIQDVRMFGSEDQLEAVAQIVNDRLSEMRASHAATLEYHRLGALRGVILDADGSTEVLNLFTLFGLSRTEVDFVLGTSTTDIRGKCMTVKRTVEAALGAAVYDHIHAYCGPTFFDAFCNHANVKAAYANWASNETLRADLRSGFPFGGIIWEEYPGTVSGVQYVADSECNFFPVGVPGLFKTFFAPGNNIEAANTLGIPVYASSEVRKHGSGVDLHTESNPLNFCTLPATLIKGKTTN